MKDASPVPPVVLVRNPNNTLELTLAGELTKQALEATLHQLLLEIVQLRDKGQQVLMFVNASAVEDTGEDVKEVALKYLQTDFDFMAIYDQSFGHRLIISKLARGIADSDRRINVFKNVDEATDWVARVRQSPDTSA
jgi:hypothetical protein